MNDTTFQYDIVKCKRELILQGLSASAVAKRVNLGKTVVANFFRGKSVSAKTARKIVLALNLQMEDVLQMKKGRRK
jgi:transcriptional regulator with XRE-family HTH domain